MKIQRLAIVLTLINLVILTLVLAQSRPTEAQGASQVLRGRALEIVDDQGRVRASLIVQKPDPAVAMPGGRAVSETVILRLVNPNGRPAVKLATSEQGAGLALVADTGPTYVLLKADDATSSLKFTNKAGREHMIEP
jgi:hypothetical protein